ncbi:hypothetical protein E2C01_101205 [Portunus trituberculatus]|uniref:Uncharacterized protein n=1 Tax=Portunus trituberculatus TaxID=210409 RepID=A0A5B7KE59_PORTR|nr:hypothetical protein [Portunus trituberculatus]
MAVPRTSPLHQSDTDCFYCGASIYPRSFFPSTSTTTTTTTTSSTITTTTTTTVTISEPHYTQSIIHSVDKGDKGTPLGTTT